MFINTEKIFIIEPMRVIAVIIFLLFSSSFAAEFGEYQYSKYIGIQQQLQNQRMIAQRRNRAYYQNPTRNIRYPSANNPYPNIQRTRNMIISPRQRYSPNYYRTFY